MTPAARALAGLWGAWRFAQFDAGGQAGFDASRAGARHALWAVALALPLYLISAGLQAAIVAAAGDVPPPLPLAVFHYALRWLVYVAGGYLLARMAGRGPNFYGFVAAYCWAKPVMAALTLPLVALGAAGLLEGAAFGLMSLALFFYLAAVQVFITRVALKVSLAEAVALFVAVYLMDNLLRFAERA